VGALEDSLIRPSPDLASKSGFDGHLPSSANADPIITEGDGFFVPQARGIYQAIATCWSSTVYIPELGHRFWKLTLQVSSLSIMRIVISKILSCRAPDSGAI
jgi:hypothetical protein